ncbi:MAG: PrgI family protein [Beduini sp.]|uniref:PrgI family protein n=1 Tax=Beduini sp. TaxID=1922300 RepID=UPI0039903ED0
MEIKINKEIRNYTESMYFGLSLRQFIFSILACIFAVGFYFIFRPYFGLGTLSWLCILSASPFAVLGFITYNGMHAEQFIWVWIKSEILMPRQIKFESSNLYWECLKQTNKQKKEVTKHDKNTNNYE